LTTPRTGNSSIRAKKRQFPSTKKMKEGGRQFSVCAGFPEREIPKCTDRRSKGVVEHKKNNAVEGGRSLKCAGDMDPRSIEAKAGPKTHKIPQHRIDEAMAAGLNSLEKKLLEGYIRAGTDRRQKKRIERIQNRARE